MEQDQNIVTDLVLLGGGHSHVIVVKLFAMNPLPGVRITLISDVDYAPYSGMIPGYIAGYYSYDEVHIDLPRLCQMAGVRLIRGEATGIDRHRKVVICNGRSPVYYDILSINVGSQPRMAKIPGAEQYATPIKPLPKFLLKLASLDEQVLAAPGQPLKILLIGGGVGGVELALALKKRTSDIQATRGVKPSCEITILQKGEKIVENLNSGARRRVEAELQSENIRYHTKTEVVEITESLALTTDGRRFDFNAIFVVTNASAQGWFKESGLQVTADGFIRVNQFLQSLGNEDIFAVGDVAHMDFSPRPKAGIFAVRQGKPLYQNLRRTLCNQQLKKFYPQKNILTILGNGKGSALAARGIFYVSGSYMWKWKELIDRKFMGRFVSIPAMKKPSRRSERTDDGSSRIRCLGCGAKVAGAVLSNALNRLTQERQPPEVTSGILVGVDAAVDAAIIRPPEGQLLVQTVDMIPAMFSDLHLFGRITALHCLSDLFAIGAKAHSVLATCVLPHAAANITANDLYEMLSGVAAELSRHDCDLIGGHTLEGNETALGLTCNGFLPASDYAPPAKLVANDFIILTKAIGVGTILRAHMMGKAQARWLTIAITSMLKSNWSAAKILNKYNIISRTDITGFGLAGHINSLMPSAGIVVDLAVAAIPLLSGAIDCFEAGFESSIAASNSYFLKGLENQSVWKIGLAELLLTDPQTSGGLLFAASPDVAKVIVEDLRAAGYAEAQVIGRVRKAVGESSSLCLVDENSRSGWLTIA